jgi:hypothetical protein
LKEREDGGRGGRGDATRGGGKGRGRGGHGVLRKREAESSGRRRKTAAGQLDAEFLKGAIDAAAGGVFGEAESAGNVGVTSVFEETEKERASILLGEAVDLSVEQRGEATPVRGYGGVGSGIGHGGGDLFAGFASALGPDGVGGFVAGRNEEPRGERGMTGDDTGAVSESHEDALRDILGEVSVSADTTKRRGIHGIDVKPDEFGKGGLVAIVSEAAEEGGVPGHHFTMATAEMETEQTFCSGSTAAAAGSQLEFRGS